MGNSPRRRAERQAARVWVPKGNYPLGHGRMLEENLWAEGPEWAELSTRLLEEEYWFAPGLSPAQHGTWNGYNNWYCRCPLCSWANTQRQANRRANATADATSERKD